MNSLGELLSRSGSNAWDSNLEEGKEGGQLRSLKQAKGQDRRRWFTVAGVASLHGDLL